MRSKPTHSIRVDDRARVPFAMIGVLLLVSSVGVVATLETRPEPRIDDDPSAALDRTTAASQTTVRAAVVDATETAAQSPLTELDPNSTIGAALAGREDDPLDAYLALLIYLETGERLEHTSQGIGGETTATASLPAVDPTAESVDRALDRIELQTPAESGVETGTLRVTVEDVSFEVERRGETLSHREQDLTVTVASTLHELHERTDEYEARLNTGIFDETTGYDGFGRRLAARLYPVAYLKIAQKYRKPDDFGNITPNEHTEVLANHAAFSIQKSTFGTTDPHGERTMRGAWACMGADIGEELMASNSNSDDGYDAAQFCSDLEYVYGDQKGELPDAPTLTELAEDEVVGSKFANATVEIPIDEFADLAYYDVVGEDVDWDEDDPMSGDAFEGSEAIDSEDTPDSLDTLIDTASGEIPSVVDSVYSTSVRAEDVVETSGALPSAEPPERVVNNTGNWTEAYAERETVVLNSETSVEGETLWRDSTDQRRPLYEYEVTLVNEYEQTRTWDWNGTEAANRTEMADDHNRTGSITSTDRSTRRFEVTVKIEGRHSHGAALDGAGYGGRVDHAFRAGGSVRPSPQRQRVGNFEEIHDGAIERVFGAHTDPDDLPSTLEQRIDPEAVFRAEQLVSTLAYEDGRWIGVPVEPDDEAALEAWLEAEVQDVRADVKRQIGPLSVERHELLTADNSPIKRYAGELRRSRASLVLDGEQGGYENAPAKARAELRLAYVESVIDAVEAVGESHEELRTGVEQEVTDRLGEDAAAANDVLDTSLGIGQDALNGDIEENAGSLDGSPLTGNARFDVRGAPTYLSLDTVEREDVAAVRPAGAPPLDTEGATHAPLTARYANPIGYPGVPVVPYPGLWFASVSVWDVEVKGEYARFEVSAADGAPDSPSGTTYIREDRRVSIDIGGKQYALGRVDPIEFSSRTLVVGVVPGGSPGVGDTDQWFDCADSWDSVGPGFDPDRSHIECPGDRDGNRRHDSE